MIKFILIRLVRFFTGLTKDQFNAIIGVAFHQDAADKASSEKKQTVTAWIASNHPELGGWAINLLRELAVAWLRKVGG